MNQQYSKLSSLHLAVYRRHESDVHIDNIFVHQHNTQNAFHTSINNNSGDTPVQKLRYTPYQLHQSLPTRTTKSIADTVTTLLTHSWEYIHTEEWTTAKARRGEEIASTTTCSATVNTSHALARTIVSSIIVVNRSRLNQGHSALVGSRQWADIRFSMKPNTCRKYNYYIQNNVSTTPVLIHHNTRVRYTCTYA